MDQGIFIAENQSAPLPSLPTRECLHARYVEGQVLIRIGLNEPAAVVVASSNTILIGLIYLYVVRTVENGKQNPVRTVLQK